MHSFKTTLRQLARFPVSNSIIVITIALLIGGLSVIYASIRQDRARLMPFPESHELVKLWRVWRVGEGRMHEFFPADVYLEYAKSLRSIETLGAIGLGGKLTLTGIGEPVSYRSREVTPSLLQLIGISPLLGRTFDESEAAPGADRVVLISEQLWRNKLGADESVVGRSIRLNDQLHTIVGVMPSLIWNTHLGHAIDVWRPARISPEQRSGNLRLIGRLKDGYSLRQARAELKTIAPQVEQAHAPTESERAAYPGGFKSAHAAPLDKNLGTARGISGKMIVVWAFTGTIFASVILIACFNVTNLLLAQVTTRSREFAIQLSLGASRARIVLARLREALILAALGAVLGLVAAVWIAGALRAQQLTAPLSVQFDWRFFLLGTFGAVVIGIVAGIVPAWRCFRTDLSSLIKESGHATAGHRRHRLRNFLVSSQVAMALVLCIVAGMMAKSFVALISEDLGFDPEKIVNVEVNLRQDRYSESADRVAYAERAIGALRQMPGVDQVAAEFGFGMFTRLSDSVGIAASEESEERTVETSLSYTDSEYLRLFGMSVIRGRLPESNEPSGVDEVVVSQSFARQFFSGADPVGKLLRFRSPDRWMTIVGVVRDRSPVTSYFGVEPEVFLNYRHSRDRSPLRLFVKSLGSPKEIEPAARDLLQSLDPAQPVSRPVHLSDAVEARVSGPKSAMLILSSLGAVGLFIALIGIYGVVAYTVDERTREIGIRMAVGADRLKVLRLILWQGTKLTLIGMIPGLLIGYAVTIALPEAMFGRRPLDPVYLIVFAIVFCAGAIASYFPARKAIRLNPMDALRQN